MKFLTVFLLLFAPLVSFAQTTPTACNLNITDALTQVFGVPALTDMTQAFAVGFTTPMTVYLASYMVGVLVNFWNS